MAAAPAVAEPAGQQRACAERDKAGRGVRAGLFMDDSRGLLK